MRMHRRIATVAALVAAGVFTFGAAGQANAADKDGYCDPGELCLFWGDHLSGAWIDFYYGDEDHRNDRFIGGPGKPGYNTTVADSAQSALNRESDAYAVVTSLLDCALGSFDVIEAGDSQQLNATYNNNWSNCWEF